MKRSAHVVAPLLAAAALAITTGGCRKPEMQRCVDETNKVVADNLCQQAVQQRRPDGHGGFIFLPSPYRYYYGGFGGYGLGSVVGGGAYSAMQGHSYSSGTTRGGFGSTLSGSGGSSAGE
jgi:hypothetical protein